MDNSFEIYAINPNVDAKGFIGKPMWGTVSASDLKNGLNTFLGNFSDVFSDCSQKIGDFYLDEIEIKVDISLSGGIRLIGAAEAKTTGGLTIKLKRRGHE